MMRSRVSSGLVFGKAFMAGPGSMMTDEINNSSVPVCQPRPDASFGREAGLFVADVVLPLIMTVHALRIVAALRARHAGRPCAAWRLAERVASRRRIRPVIRHALSKGNGRRAQEDRGRREKNLEGHGSISRFCSLENGLETFWFG